MELGFGVWGGFRFIGFGAWRGYRVWSLEYLGLRVSGLGAANWGLRVTSMGPWVWDCGLIVGAMGSRVVDPSSAAKRWFRV